MMEANCRKWTVRVVECVRTGSEPGADLRDHLRECPHCRERREDEQRLTAQLRIARDAARLHRPSEARRSQILVEFDMAQRRSIRPLLKWATAAAAILLAAIGLVEMRRSAIDRTPTAPPPAIAQESPEVEGLQADSNGFIAVPYAPPLATGEFVSVVRTELQPTALARMGVYVDPGYSADIPADVVVGEDGLPRAVRLVEAMEF